MTLEETKRVLRTLCAAYGRRTDEAMDETWAISLVRVDTLIATDCALDWVEHEPAMPTLNAFLAACQAEARHRAVIAPALPAAPRATIDATEQHRRSRGQAALLNDMVRGLREGDPLDDDEILARLRTERLGPLASENEPRLCRCGGTGMRLIDENANVAIPCQSCNPEAYALWAGGHYEPGHHCAVCRTQRRRTRDSD